jgi:NADPH:quinone reductase-like Zn-dependent oxidoreductase
MKGLYVDFNLFEIPYPNTPGWEGAGIVVASGGGMMTWGSIGKRVAFVRKITNENHMVTGGCY